MNHFPLSRELSREGQTDDGEGPSPLQATQTRVKVHGHREAFACGREKALLPLGATGAAPAN